MIMNKKKGWYIQWHYIWSKMHCRQYPQWHSGPDHFCIDFLKDDIPFDIFKLLDRLFHILLPWYLNVLWPYMIVLNLGYIFKGSSWWQEGNENTEFFKFYSASSNILV